MEAARAEAVAKNIESVLRAETMSLVNACYGENPRQLRYPLYILSDENLKDSLGYI